MSEFAEHRDIGTCQEKLAPPRSLRDKGEDSEMIWNVIVERYPRAAPLLCEMEVAIERAENLLHKFRTAPYSNIREIENRPSSTRILNSDESSTMLTANSGTELSTSEENDDVEEVGTRMSDDSISKNEDQINRSSSSSNSDNEVHKQEYGNTSSPSVPQFIVDESINTDVIQDSKSSNKDPTGILDDTISLASKVIDMTKEIQSTATKIPKREITLSPKRRTDSSPIKKTTKDFVPIGVKNEKIKSEKEKMENNDDESSSKSPSRKTAVTILKDYAEQCNEKLEFKVIRNKINSSEIECSFASYSAKSVGYPESSVKNEVAVLILRMIAEEQMDEKDLKNLIPFSTEQMRDVVALGTGGQPENAMRKLYKLCLEKNAPKPVYTVQKGYVSEGVKNIAECTALKKTATGVGIRETVAKKAAAEKLYTQLLSEQSS